MQEDIVFAKLQIKPHVYYHFVLPLCKRSLAASPFDCRVDYTRVTNVTIQCLCPEATHRSTCWGRTLAGRDTTTALSHLTTIDGPRVKGLGYVKSMHITESVTWLGWGHRGCHAVHATLSTVVSSFLFGHPMHTTTVKRWGGRWTFPGNRRDFTH